MSFIGFQSTRLNYSTSSLIRKYTTMVPDCFGRGKKIRIMSYTPNPLRLGLSINFRTRIEKASLDLIFLLPMILGVVQMDDRHVEITQGALVDGMDQTAKHQSVTVIPATGSVISGWRGTTAHDMLIGMLYRRRGEENISTVRHRMCNGYI